MIGLGLFTVLDYRINDYYPFGMQMPGRKYGAFSYRYGYNNKENLDEVGVEGGTIDLGSRVYNPRLGKLLSIDPKRGQYPELTPYQFAANKPIECIDLLGEQNLDYRFSAKFSLSFGSNGINFRVAGAVGVSYTTGAAQISSSSNINIYNGGLGTAGKSNKVQFDVSNSVYLTIGAGSFAASKIKTINSKTESPIDNNYAASVTVGNAYSYSSGLAGDGGSGANKNLFFDFKGGPASATYSNDDRLFKKGSFLAKTIGGSGNDKSFTTTLCASLNTDALGLGKLYGVVSYGTDIFTGEGKYQGQNAPYILEPGENSQGDIFYEQTPYQRSLNKSSKFLSIGLTRIDYDNGAKAQHDQHTGKGTSVLPGVRVGETSNPLFNYDQTGAQSVETSTPTIIK